MTYYSTLWTTDHWGYTNIGKHSSKQNAIASLRRKMMRIEKVSAGYIFNAKPPKDADDEWTDMHYVGVMLPKRKGNHVEYYVYTPIDYLRGRGKDCIVRSDGTLIPY